MKPFVFSLVSDFESSNLFFGGIVHNNTIIYGPFEEQFNGDNSKVQKNNLQFFVVLVYQIWNRKRNFSRVLR